MLAPGATIGILGGGQLGRMLSLAAAQLGYRVLIYSPETPSVAAEVSAGWCNDDWHDMAALTRFGDRCDVVTWEWENVPTAPLTALAPKLAAPVRALEVAQDRLQEKRFVAGLGGTPAPFVPVDTPADLDAALEQLGTPAILKTRRDGYDGKGQWRIGSRAEAAALDLPQVPLICEKQVEFEAEFSVLLVRSRTGDHRFWDSPHNVHRDGMLATSTLPAPACVTAQTGAARALAAQVADALDYVGVLTLEFFATLEGPVFNEMAPRVHNSGHWTIEGAATSQFDAHIRAICGLPAGDTRTVADRIALHNIIGPRLHEAHDWLSQPDTHLHLYGKKDALPGRKMGHVTRLWRGGTGGHRT
ncbi:5-(carboxyamino)imidazole ribonucleotide synthase [Erythrobacteraceae bacterium CFH 75059]|uniref:5-(carboxyamino)imidazole ribonucleotide synthase n=1 Tax=Qipengyuania thermophila TaxID=2509361 RepID=UPI0010219DBB|nr:5-(carboxyamino)imidazole ribonucleotide synthase [Qipengyuania thermophila]TCD06755.1 5-(carboxyamino)imidazole ribonucleotide synthase [Erythrobacteraceae bacterium CFH 75059]